MNIGVFRFEGECLLVGGFCLIDSALGLVEVAEIDYAFGVVGLEGEGFLVGGEGVFGLFQLNEGGAEIVEDQRVIGSDFERFSIMVGGFGVVLTAEEDVAEAIVCLDISWPKFNSLLI